MATVRRRRYTNEEKVAYVTAIASRYPSDGQPLDAIAKDLGISVVNYYNWVKAGIRPQTAEPKRATTHRPYEQTERERLKAEVDRLRQSGMGIKLACQSVGISDKSYHKWSLNTESPAPAMRPVEITALVTTPQLASVPVSGLTLVAPGGYRVEGLSIETAAGLLRALS